MDESAKAMIEAVERGIDRLNVHKDNIAYTFNTTIKSAVDFYFNSIKKNEKEQKRYAVQTAKFNALVEKGRNPDWKVVPLDVVDLEVSKQTIKNIISNMIASTRRLCLT